MKILIAEDNTMARMGLKSMLTEMGHTVIAARDGREALEQARNTKPDLAILDIDMPKTNGLQAARAFNKSMPLPIIFLTAFGQEELIEKATDLNVQGYLIKPVGSAELTAAISIASKRFRDQKNEAAARQKAEDKLKARKLIDRAKASLIASGMTEDEAFAHIQQAARTENKTMAAIAQSILND